MTQEQKTYCEVHPDRETALRCNRCNRLMCTECAVLTPTGYRCKECIREQSKVFDTAQIQDYVFAFIAAGILSYIGSWAAQFLGFFLLFVAPAIGIGMAEIVRRVVNKRRSKQLFITATAGVVVGGLINVLPLLFYAFLGGPQALVGLIWPLIYVVLAASSFYARLSGIQLRW
jgi:hypothetical protein